MRLGLPELDFQQIKNGQKTVELRAPSESKNYTLLDVGSELVFINEESGESIATIVQGVKLYATIDDLLNEIPINKINPHLKSKKEVGDKLFSIPTYKERIEKEGVYSISIELKQ